MKTHEKLRVCGCCGEFKQTRAFSWNHKKKEYSPNCRECGVWLKLFREVFGQARYMDRVRARQAISNERIRVAKIRAKSAPANELFSAWGIGVAA